MKIYMLLLPDMKNKVMRQINADLPDDLTQKEFWDFVKLVGSQLFGETSESGDSIYSKWNMGGQFL